MAALLFSMGFLSLGETECFNGTITLEVGLYAILSTDIINAFA